MKKVIIIGSGFGGLSLAVRLQAKGFNVEIFEKNSKVGGHASQMKKDGFVFDMGPSLITAPDIIGRIFESAGKKIEDYLDMIPLDPFYRIYFHDGTHIDYNGGSERMIRQMEQFNPKDAANYHKFIDYSRKIYDAVITEGLGSTPFNKLSTMLKFFPRALKLGALSPAYTQASKFFSDFRHRFMFSFHPLFIGGNPFRVPSIYLMISYLEKAGGVWFTKGGMYSLIRAFEKVFLESGGKIRTNSEIREIAMKNGRAAGVKTDGGYFPADIVVSNADLTHTYGHLIKKGSAPRWNKNRLQKAKYSMSSYILYLGVKKKYPELLHHTLILSPRYKELIGDIFDNQILPEDFSMYLHAPTRTDPSMAPEGCESLYILVPVTNLKGNVNWQQIQNEFGDRIIDYLENKFGLEGLRENIVVRDQFTPVDFQKQRNSHLGSPWGFEPVLTQSAYFRAHNRSENIDNLYLVGAGTHPGAGLPGVMLSAEATEKMILKQK